MLFCFFVVFVVFVVVVAVDVDVVVVVVLWRMFSLLFQCGDIFSFVLKTIITVIKYRNKLDCKNCL